MRSKKALLNTGTGMVYECVVVICGLILPRFILHYFGSEYNGITASISQFLSGISLLKAGIGGVTRAALYEPLEKRDTEKISSIVKTTERFMQKIAYIFLVLVGVFACIYPGLINNQFEWWFSCSLILILSIGTFAQYFFGSTYQMLLQADQQQCIVYVVQIVSTIINTVIAVFLIVQGCSIHVVKLGSAFVFLINPIVLNVYAKKRYKLNVKAAPDNKLISQRWDAFGQELAFFIHNNTDIVVLTIFTDLFEVSVYTIYNYVITGIRSVVVIFITGFGAAFGNMLARKETELMEKNLKIYELIVFSLVSIIYSVTAVMIVPYAILYTEGVNDVDYARPVFALLMVMSGAFSCFRIPYKTITDAAGHFKRTRQGAFIEAGLNIFISVAAVIKFGLIGVAVGTLVATIFRAVQYAMYMSKNILQRGIWEFGKHVIICIATGVVVYVFAELFVLPKMVISIDSWIICAMVVFIVAVFLTVLADYVFYRNELIDLIRKLKNVLHKRGS